MTRAILDELRKLSPDSSPSERLRIGRELRFLLLHLIDSAGNQRDTVETAVLSLTNAVMKFQNDSSSSCERLTKVLQEHLAPISLTSAGSEAERRALVQSLIPDEFTELKDEIAENPTSASFLSSLIHTFQFYDYLQRENVALQKRNQSLRNLVSAAPSVLSPSRKSPVRLGSPTSSVKFGSCREADEFAKTSRVEKRLHATIEKRQKAVGTLQAEVEQLKAQLQGMKQQGTKAPLDSRTVAAVEAKQTETDELAAQIAEATKENLRLKELLGTKTP
jgi:hypothetical protein